ncbi:hypothetical protein Dimus_019845 [Dionaea muscipula]
MVATNEKFSFYLTGSTLRQRDRDPAPAAGRPPPTPISISVLLLLLFSPSDGGGKGWKIRWMARTNKYTSLNFNDIYEKQFSSSTTSSSSSSSSSPARPSKSYSLSASSRLQGGMLVLTRPSPKLPSQPPPSPSPSLSQQQRQQQQQQQLHPPPQQSDQTQVDPDSGISLRPLGRTGSGPSLTPSPSLDREREAHPPVLPSPPKSDKFVPPHLRPGFTPREGNPVQPEFQRPGSGGGGRPRESGNKYYRSGSFVSYGEDGRPKSGGGYERTVRRGGNSDLGELNRPRSGRSRPSSSG